MSHIAPARSDRPAVTRRAARRRLRTLAVVAVGAATLVAAAACGGGGGSASAGSSSGPGKGQQIKVGAYAFPEGQLLANVYAKALDAAGFKATVVQTQGRETGEPALSQGSLDVIPEYTSSLLDYFKAGTSSPDDAANLSALRTEAQAKGVNVLDPAPATDNYAFGVLDSFAKSNKIASLSDLAAYSQAHPVTVAGIQECADRTYCLAGLKSVYGLQVADFKVTVLASQASVDLLKKNTVQLVQFDSSDGVLADNPVKILEDDKGLNHADHIVAAVNAKSDSPALDEVLNSVNGKLTQTLLNSANKQVQVDRVPAVDQAADLLKKLS